MSEMKVEKAKGAKKPKKVKAVKKPEKAPYDRKARKAEKKAAKKQFKKDVKISKLNSGERLIVGWTLALTFIGTAADLMEVLRKKKEAKKAAENTESE